MTPFTLTLAVGFALATAGAVLTESYGLIPVCMLGFCLLALDKSMRDLRRTIFAANVKSRAAEMEAAHRRLQPDRQGHMPEKSQVTERPPAPGRMKP